MSINKDIELLNNEISIKKEIKYNLKEMFSDLKKDDLKVYINNYGLKGYSKLKKAELIDAICEMMFNDNSLGNKVKELNTEELNIVQTLVENGNMDITDVDSSKYIKICSLGVALPYIDGEVLRLVMATEIKEVVTSLGLVGTSKVIAKKKNVQTKVKTEVDDTLMIKYLASFANVYGAFETEFFTKVFNSQNDKKITVEALVKYFEANGNKVGKLQLVDGIIADEILLATASDLEKLLSARGNKEYKILNENLISKYSDDNFIEMTEGYRSLLKALKEIVKANENIDEVLLALNSYFRNNDFDVESILNILSDYINIDIIQNVKDVEHIVKNSVAAYCETRRWDAKGFTKNELSSHIVQKPLEVKIKRNDPCLCGSGKKYKKCCL